MDQAALAPKIEEMSEDYDESVSSPRPSAQGTPTPSDPGPGTVKRGRGRPRKHPLPSSPGADSKIAKGRSKTGCITCRRRKKKCDETKPHCLNCQKNAVVCEGYPERVVWKSGRQKAEEARAARQSTRPRELPILIDGVETDIDRLFLAHYSHHVSEVLTVDNQHNNPFKKILLPMATRHKGLMHSLLCLSGSHLAQAQSESENLAAFNDRQNHHLLCAIENLRNDEGLNGQALGTSSEPVDDNTVAATLVLVLRSICAGELKGEYKPHLDAAQALLASRNASGPQSSFAQFIYEFFVYHNQLCAVTSIDHRNLALTEDFTLPQFIVQPEAGALLGVLDGLFGYISRITRLRDHIRYRKEHNEVPLVDYSAIIDAVAIDDGIRTWVPVQQPGTEGYIAAQLYRQCTWIYLYRTTHSSRPAPKICEAVDEGLEYLRQLNPDASTQSILLMPLFLLGCAAFHEEQRKDIKRAFGTLKRYSQLGNIEPARTVVERVWKLMDAGDESSWDWETVIKDMGWDFLVT